MATKNNPGKYDCYHNAEPDEPMFVLLARDKHAVPLIWLWQVMRELDGENPEKLREARECCVSMMEWQQKKGKKSAGVAESVLAGVLEMIRTINQTKEDLKNDRTDTEVFRRYLCESSFPDAGKGTEIVIETNAT